MRGDVGDDGGCEVAGSWRLDEYLCYGEDMGVCVCVYEIEFCWCGKAAAVCVCCASCRNKMRGFERRGRGVWLFVTVR